MPLDASEQLKILRSSSWDFKSVLPDGVLRAEDIRAVQLNLGKKCNQACKHCHVGASPKRTEAMDRETAELCLALLGALPGTETLDLTGGAPEMNENFVFLVEGARALGKKAIDRCNLTILEEPGYEYLYDFLADREVEIVASLPHFAQDRVDRQRGRGVFERSITALGKLNERGYGRKLPLHLVYNPAGLFLSVSQETLRGEYAERLLSDYGIVFNELYCLNNLPVTRFLEALLARDKFEDYMELLAESFNPVTLDGLMCRHQISIGYDGTVYDCDFNQMLELPARGVSHVREFDCEKFMAREIRVENHCYGCTAGAGSSCGGELLPVQGGTSS